MREIIVSTSGTRLGKRVIRRLADGEFKIIELSENPSRNSDCHQRTSLSDIKSLFSIGCQTDSGGYIDIERELICLSYNYLKLTGGPLSLVSCSSSAQPYSDWLSSRPLLSLDDCYYTTVNEVHGMLSPDRIFARE